MQVGWMQVGWMQLQIYSRLCHYRRNPKNARNGVGTEVQNNAFQTDTKRARVIADASR